jgi:hypothetical protein
VLIDTIIEKIDDHITKIVNREAAFPYFLLKLEIPSMYW